MTTMASQITSLTVVYSTVYSDADQRKHQSSASLAIVWGIHRDRWIPRTKGQLPENISIWWRHHDFARFLQALKKKKRWTKKWIINKCHLFCITGCADGRALLDYSDIRRPLSFRFVFHLLDWVANTTHICVKASIIICFRPNKCWLMGEETDMSTF